MFTCACVDHTADLIYCCFLARVSCLIACVTTTPRHVVLPRGSGARRACAVCHNAPSSSLLYPLLLVLPSRCIGVPTSSSPDPGEPNPALRFLARRLETLLLIGVDASAAADPSSARACASAYASRAVTICDSRAASSFNELLLADDTKKELPPPPGCRPSSAPAPPPAALPCSMRDSWCLNRYAAIKLTMSKAPPTAAPIAAPVLDDACCFDERGRTTTVGDAGDAGGGGSDCGGGGEGKRRRGGGSGGWLRVFVAGAADDDVVVVVSDECRVVELGAAVVSDDAWLVAMHCDSDEAARPCVVLPCGQARHADAPATAM